jgi:uncharacterized membrane protein YgcG
MSTGPIVLTIREFKTQSQEKIKFSDVQNHLWNCDNPGINPHIKEGQSYQVWYDEREYDFTNEAGERINGKNKWIVKAAPSEASQESKPVYQAGGGGKSSGGSGGSHGGGGGKGSGDYRTSGENIVQEALDAASRIMASLAPTMAMAANGDLEAVLPKIRVETMKMAEVFAELVREKGQQMGRSDAAASSGSKPAQGSFGDTGGGWGAKDPDDDIPFGDGV